MSWSLCASWPVRAGDEVTAAHFEDLRKLYWAWVFGLSGEPDAGTLPAAYDAEAVYYHGGLCIFEDYYYTFCPPERYEDEEGTIVTSITGLSPAESSLWVRTARVWVYTDFYPSHICSVCQWRDFTPTAGVWRIIPAWQMLPAPLNPYTQTHLVRAGYELPRPAEELHGYGVETPVRFMRNYNDPRYGFGGSNSLKQIVSGFIGPQFPYIPGVSRPYMLFNGTPHEGDFGQNLFDWKMGGYQSFVERLCESNGGWRRSLDDDDFFWEGDPEDPPNYLKPAVAAQNHPFWRCNESAFELILKKLNNFDWFLDLTTPPQAPAIVGLEPSLAESRKGCWRRMWKESHYYPANAHYDGTSSTLLVWPGEMGTPPYADDEIVEGAPRFATLIEAYAFWVDAEEAGNIQTVIDAAVAALNNSANAAAVAALHARHLPRERLWHKTFDHPVPTGYTEVYFGEHTAEEREFYRDEEPDLWWWYEDAYELTASLVQDIYDVIGQLELIHLEGAVDLRFYDLGNYHTDLPDGLQFSTFAAARDYGSEWTGWQVGASAGTSGFLGIGDEASGGLTPSEASITRAQPTELSTPYFVKNNKKILSGFVLRTDSVSPEFQAYLDQYPQLVLYFKLSVIGSRGGQSLPVDDDLIVYNIPTVKSDSPVAGIRIEANSYAVRRTQWAAAPYDETLEGWTVKPDMTFADDWTIAPPPTSPPSITSTSSRLHSILGVSAFADVCVGVSPLWADLQNSDDLRDTP